MKPVEPVLNIPLSQVVRTVVHLENNGIRPVTYAKDQPEYLPLPVLRSFQGTVTSRWRMTWRERLAALFTGDVYLTQLTFNSPLQPVRLQVTVPTVEELL